jgi:DNA-binding transcriptional ArsR family regulator
MVDSDPRTVRVASNDRTASRPQSFQESRTVTSPTATRVFDHPDLDDVEITTVLFALSEPARLELVRQLAAQGPQTVAQCHTVDPTVPKSTFSHHLKTLRESGVIRNEPAGRQRTISLRREDLDRRFPGLLASVLSRPARVAPHRPSA